MEYILFVRVLKCIRSILSYFVSLLPFWRISSEKKNDLEYPSILLNPVYGSHKFAKLPGITLHYVENGDKNNELLLFIHGFPEFWFSWREQITHFSKDYWTIAVDMRGYAESDKKTCLKNYMINTLADDIKNFIYYLGRSKCTLVAHDWGGAVGHHFIRTYPNMLNRYILLNTVFHIKLIENIFKNKEQFCKSWYIFLTLLPGIPEYLLKANNYKVFDYIFGKFSTMEEINAYKYMYRKYDQRKGPVNYYRANFNLTAKSTDYPTVNTLNSLNVPGLYIHGDRDFAITQEVAMKDSFEGVQNIKFVNIPDGGHFVHIKNATTVNRIMRRFLEQARD